MRQNLIFADRGEPNLLPSLRLQREQSVEAMAWNRRCLQEARRTIAEADALLARTSFR
jgi:hypothetical protein